MIFITVSFVGLFIMLAGNLDAGTVLGDLLASPLRSDSPHTPRSCVPTHSATGHPSCLATA